MQTDEDDEKDYAVFLRLLGWSYRDIAEELRCSVTWCAQNLKGVAPDRDLMREASELLIEKTTNTPLRKLCS
jgi:hypothetical protein